MFKSKFTIFNIFYISICPWEFETELKEIHLTSNLLLEGTEEYSVASSDIKKQERI